MRTNTAAFGQGALGLRVGAFVLLPEPFHLPPSQGIFRGCSGDWEIEAKVARGLFGFLFQPRVGASSTWLSKDRPGLSVFSLLAGEPC